MPDGDESSFKKGIKAFKEKRFDDAAGLLLEVVENYPENHKAWNALGVTLSARGEKQQAKTCFQNALTFDPDNPVYQRNLQKIDRKKPVQTETQPPEKEDGKKRITKKIIFGSIILTLFLFSIGIIVLSISSHNTTGESNKYNSISPVILEALSTLPSYIVHEKDDEGQIVLRVIDNPDADLIKSLNYKLGDTQDYTSIEYPEVNHLYPIGTPSPEEKLRLIAEMELLDGSSEIIIDTSIDPVPAPEETLIERAVFLEPTPAITPETSRPLQTEVIPEQSVKPPCSCTGDIYNCPDFESHAKAEECFTYCRKTTGQDIHRLDADGDGEFCESLK